MSLSFLCIIFAFESVSTVEIEAGVREIIFVIVMINLILFLPRCCFGAHPGGLEKEVIFILYGSTTGCSNCKGSIVIDWTYFNIFIQRFPLFCALVLQCKFTRPLIFTSTCLSRFPHRAP